MLEGGLNDDHFWAEHAASSGRKVSQRRDNPMAAFRQAGGQGTQIHQVPQSRATFPGQQYDRHQPEAPPAAVRILTSGEEFRSIPNQPVRSHASPNRNSPIPREPELPKREPMHALRNSVTSITVIPVRPEAASG